MEPKDDPIPVLKVLLELGILKPEDVSVVQKCLTNSDYLACEAERRRLIREAQVSTPDDETFSHLGIIGRLEQRAHELGEENRKLRGEVDVHVQVSEHVVQAMSDSARLGAEAIDGISKYLMSVTGAYLPSPGKKPDSLSGLVVGGAGVGGQRARNPLGRGVAEPS